MAPNLGVVTNILTWIFTGAATIIVALRLVSRLKLNKLAGWDDLVIVISLLIVLLLSCLISYSITQGLGTHIAALSPRDAINASKWAVATDTVGIFSFTVPKLGIAILLSRILSLGDRPPLLHQFLIYVPAVFMIAFSFAACGVWLGQCKPTKGLWDKTIDADCLNPDVYMWVSGVVGTSSAFVDFFYGIYPVAMIWKLNMDSRRKMHLSLMLGLSVVGGALAIWKTTLLPAISKPGADITYRSLPLLYATVIEADMIIIAACIPTIGPVARKIASTASSVGTKIKGGDVDSTYHQFDDERVLKPQSTSKAFAAGANPSSSDPDLRDVHELRDLYQGRVGMPAERAQRRPPGSRDVEVLAETTVDVSVSRDERDNAVGTAV